MFLIPNRTFFGMLPMNQAVFSLAMGILARGDSMSHYMRTVGKASDWLIASLCSTPPSSKEKSDILIFLLSGRAAVTQATNCEFGFGNARYRVPSAGTLLSKFISGLIQQMLNKRSSVSKQTHTTRSFIKSFFGPRH